MDAIKNIFFAGALREPGPDEGRKFLPGGRKLSEGTLPSPLSLSPFSLGLKEKKKIKNLYKPVD